MIPGKWISSIQAEAQLKFNEWNESKNTVVLDTETTGLHGAEIVEIAVVDLDGNVLFNSLVKPANPIPLEAQSIHHITNDMVKDAPTWPETWQQLYPKIRDKKLLIYNSEFDRRLMMESFYPWKDKIDQIHEFLEQASRLDTECVMKAYANLVGAEKWLKLQEAVGREISHRALDDCLATREVIKKAYDPDFTELDYHRNKIYERYQFIEFQLKGIADQLEDLGRQQRKFLQEREKCLAALLDEKQLQEYIKAKDEVAAAESVPKEIDIEDEDLPF